MKKQMSQEDEIILLQKYSVIELKDDNKIEEEIEIISK
jgi:hypothetical protein